MHSQMQGLTRRRVRRLSIAGALALCPLLSIAAQEITSEADSRYLGATAEQIQSWHENLKNYAPLEKGCFHTSFPSVQWEKTTCGPAPVYRSAVRPPAAALASGIPLRTTDGVAFTAGNGTDYVAQTTGITQSATGSFPTAKGITSEKGVGVSEYGGGGVLGANEYTLQLNSNISSSSVACSYYGYSSCQVWSQFVYSTKGKADGYTYPSEVFIQTWVFPSTADYNRKGCPSGWEDYQGSCYKNSQAASTPSVSATALGNTKLSGSVSGGTDTVIFTYGSQAYSASEPDTTTHLGSWWKQSEFNVVGNGGGSEAVFNRGVTLGVSVAVKDGTTNAPTCVSNAGTTGESNNLTLGSCKATGGTSPSISFSESD